MRSAITLCSIWEFLNRRLIVEPESAVVAVMKIEIGDIGLGVVYRRRSVAWTPDRKLRRRCRCSTIVDDLLLPLCCFSFSLLLLKEILHTFRSHRVVEVEGASLTLGFIFPSRAAGAEATARSVGVEGVCCPVAAISHETNDDGVGDSGFDRQSLAFGETVGEVTFRFWYRI